MEALTSSGINLVEVNPEAVYSPLDGIHVLEIASELAPFAGQVLAGLGASVTVVEPPNGHYTREWGPSVGADSIPTVDQAPGLWWWHYHVGKESVAADLGSEAGINWLANYLSEVDVFIEGEEVLPRPVRDQLLARWPRLIWLSITPYGSENSQGELFTDLTLMASGGPVWSCGYDNHELPPLRPGNNHAQHMAGAFGVMGVLSGIVNRATTGQGVFIDVSAVACMNVSVEGSTYNWLANEQTVQRQTGRHARPVPTEPTQVMAGDGRYIHLGPPKRDGATCRALLTWMDELNCREELDSAPILELLGDGESFPEEGQDVLGDEIFRTQREALALLASKQDGLQFFLESQRRGFACGLIYSPEEAFEDEHFKIRGGQCDVYYPELGESVRYPSPPVVAAGLARGYRRGCPLQVPTRVDLASVQREA